MAEIDRVIDDLAKQVHNPVPDTSQLPECFLRFATVISVGATTAVIQFAGSAKQIPSVHWASGMTFIASNTVAVIQFKVPKEETGYFIIGKVS